VGLETPFAARKRSDYVVKDAWTKELGIGPQGERGKQHPYKKKKTKEKNKIKKRLTALGRVPHANVGDGRKGGGGRRTNRRLIKKT